jgi:hypothetical protein
LITVQMIVDWIMTSPETMENFISSCVAFFQTFYIFIHDQSKEVILSIYDWLTNKIEKLSSIFLSAGPSDSGPSNSGGEDFSSNSGKDDSDKDSKKSKPVES